MLGGVLLTKRAFLSWKLDSHKINMYIEMTYIFILPVLVKKTKKMMMMITRATILMIIADNSLPFFHSIFPHSFETVSIIGNPDSTTTLNYNPSPQLQSPGTKATIRALQKQRC